MSWNGLTRRSANSAALLTRMSTVRDRKSTRLNSSHSQISYAVFCLKKKKTTHRDASPTRPPPQVFAATNVAIIYSASLLRLELAHAAGRLAFIPPQYHAQTPPLFIR